MYDEGMLKVDKTELAGVFMVTPPTVFRDFRGAYIETYNQKAYKELEIEVDQELNFVQDDISSSAQNVLRGIHGDQKTWKLISCLHGSFYLVVVNNDPESPEFRKWQAFNLSEENSLQILVPPKFGNGHLVTSEKAIFHYKQTTYYDREGQFTIIWDDSEFSIKWPTVTPILSERDAGV
jgi:dTDP-4-dehydrorhamnose 3,5-epimerase